MLFAQSAPVAPDAKSGVIAAGVAEASDVIEVVAARDKCRIRMAGRTLSDRDLATHADIWTRGRAVRVLEPRGANRRCLARILFKLHDKGIPAITFVDQPEPE